MTLAEELEYTRSYIAIQRLRFRGGVIVGYDIAGATEDTPIPKLSVQPLVENAFVHGILASPQQKGTIEIRARRDDEVVLVEVQDDGPGFGNDDLLGSKAGARAGSAYGLRNVDERIKLQFGERYGVRLERRGDLTVAQLTLPALSPPPASRPVGP